MGQVSVTVGGRHYPLSCADGEEGYLASLGAMLDAKAAELTAAIGTMSEPRLLLMAGLQVADDLAAARSGERLEAEAASATPAQDSATSPDTAAATDAALLARIEALATLLEG